jgi:hypothetical protein
MIIVEGPAGIGRGLIADRLAERCGLHREIFDDDKIDADFCHVRFYTTWNFRTLKVWDGYHLREWVYGAHMNDMPHGVLWQRNQVHEFLRDSGAFVLIVYSENPGLLPNDRERIANEEYLRLADKGVLCNARWDASAGEPSEGQLDRWVDAWTDLP